MGRRFVPRVEPLCCSKRERGWQAFIKGVLGKERTHRDVDTQQPEEERGSGGPEEVLDAGGTRLDRQGVNVRRRVACDLYNEVLYVLAAVGGVRPCNEKFTTVKSFL